MKKSIIICLAVMGLSTTMFAQTDKEAEKAAKAAEKAAKEEAKQAKKDAMALFEQGYKCYEQSNNAMSEFNSWKSMQKDAEKVAARQAELNAQMLELAKEGDPLLQKAFATGLVEEKKYFDGWRARDFMLSQLINVELQHASKKEPFDTAFFSTAASDMCDACYYQLKYGKQSDEQQSIMMKQASAKLPSLGTYLAYACQFQIERKNVDGACEALDNYKNFPVKYAGYVDAYTPQIPYAQFAFNIYYTAFQAKRFDVCEKYYNEAMKFDDKESHAFVAQSRPQIYLQQGDTARWVGTLKELIESDPTSSSSEAATQNLLAYYSSKGNKEMSDFADDMLAKNPNSKIANYGKGYVFINQQKYAEAIPYYEKSIEIDPEYVDGNYMLGFCYYQIGLENGRKISDKKYKTQAEADKEGEALVKSYLRKAAPYFEKVRELQPETSNRWASELKVIYQNLGQKAKAAELSNY
ncbi:MAG: tetratricopeptide repeat protein [Bacteroidales bacterium]|nr:tetratricopeptide repeat protein [Candidatus Physcousia equi]